MAELAQLGGVQEVERLQQRWPLAPRAAGKQPDIAKRGLDRLLEARTIAVKIVGRQKAAVLLLKGDDGASDVAPIKGIARRGKAGFASAMTCGGLLVHHVLKGGCEVLLH